MNIFLAYFLGCLFAFALVIAMAYAYAKRTIAPVFQKMVDPFSHAAKQAREAANGFAVPPGYRISHEPPSPEVFRGIFKMGDDRWIREISVILDDEARERAANRQAGVS
jgi:hypothetical protein